MMAMTPDVLPLANRSMVRSAFMGIRVVCAGRHRRMVGFPKILARFTLLVLLLLYQPRVWGDIPPFDRLSSAEFFEMTNRPGLSPNMDGNGMSPQAFQRLCAAAQKGEVRAEYALGAVYDSGKLVARDASEAVKWYLKAA